MGKIWIAACHRCHIIKLLYKVRSRDGRIYGFCLDCCAEIKQLQRIRDAKKEA